MPAQVMLGDIAVDVVLKDIKHVHLSVYPPTGKVRISAPRRMNLDTIRVFAVSRLGWIKQQQRKLREQVRETPREYLERESHYVWGRRYLLAVSESDQAPLVELKPNQLALRLRPGTPEAKRQVIVEEWYRDELRKAVPPLLAKWEPLVGARASAWGIKKMKTRWGTCNSDAGRVWLNLELAKKPPACLEYVLVHELVHLRERRHNDRFTAMLDRLMPSWRTVRAELNRAPLAHQDWTY